MNEKEARKKHKQLNHRMVEGLSYEIGLANGYLEAIEKAKVLEEAIKTFLEFEVYGGSFEITEGKEFVQNCPLDDYNPYPMFKEALAKWEKVK